MSENNRYDFIAAQPGWRVIVLGWPDFDRGQVDQYEVDQAPIIAWRVESEKYQGELINCGAEAIWAGGRDLGDISSHALLAPDGSVYTNLYRFVSVDEYAVWDWVNIAVKSEWGDERIREIAQALIQQYQHIEPLRGIERRVRDAA